MAAVSKRPPLTHFLCIPLVTARNLAQWQASLDRFTLDATTTTAATSATGTYPSTSSTISPRAKLATPASLHEANSADTAGPSNSSYTTSKLGGAGSTSEAQTAVETNRDVGVATISRPGPIPTKAVRPLHSIHLTLGVMSLGDNDKIDEASKLLKELDVAELLRSEEVGGKGNALAEPRSTNEEVSADAKSGKPLRLTMRSLRPMQSARSTSVLYAEADESTGRLLPLCKALRATFIEKGFLVDEGRDLLLHATIVNTLQAKAKWPKKAKKLPAGWGKAKKQRPDAQARGQAAHLAGRAQGADEPDGVRLEASMEQSNITDRGKIDGRWLIERWKDHVWAEVELDKVAICEMGAKADENGVVRYKEIAEVGLLP